MWSRTSPARRPATRIFSISSGVLMVMLIAVLGVRWRKTRINDGASFAKQKAGKMAYCAGFQLVGNRMKILLLGKDGQVGWQLQRSLAPHGEVVACGRAECNLADAAQIRSVVRAL